jgi:hypothetical protein
VSARAFPKPSEIQTRREPVIIYPDGREVCDTSTAAGYREYRRRTLYMLQRQEYQCGLIWSARCPGFTPFESATFDHQDGRGMDGAHQDDRIEKDGKPYNCAACIWCNIEKGSQRAQQG